MLVQPEDWDDEEDGEWTVPTIPNPEYKGPWKPKVCGNLVSGIFCAYEIGPNLLANFVYDSHSEN